MSKAIVCVGAVVQDEVYRVARLPAAGIKVAAESVEERFGGPAATAAVAVSNLGGTAAYWGRVGTDTAGMAALSSLTRHGVDTTGVAVIPEGRTRRAVVMVDDHGERCIIAYRKGLPEDANFLPKDNLDNVAVVLADSRWPEGSVAVFARAKVRGIPTIIDADGGSRDDTARIMALADHVVFSAEGLRDYAGDGDPAELLRRCAVDAGSKVFAVTRGAAGSLWHIDGKLSSVPAFKVPVIDTTGCGDVFHGAYALGLAEGLATIEAARFASAVAAVKAARGRGWEGMPSRTNVMDFLAAAS